MSKTHTYIALVLGIVALGLLYIGFGMDTKAPAMQNGTGDEAQSGQQEPVIYKDLIRLESPRPQETISSPLVVRGEARGNWYFEATFPLVLVDWDGRIIAEGFAEAQDDPENGSADGAGWMTEEYVPFEGELTFEQPYEPNETGEVPDFMKNGSLILRKANASGLPEHDDALEIQVRFE